MSFPAFSPSGRETITQKRKFCDIMANIKKYHVMRRNEMTVDSTSLLVALKQKPHPSDAGSEVVCVREEKQEAEEMKNGKRENEKVF